MTPVAYVPFTQNDDRTRERLPMKKRGVQSADGAEPNNAQVQVDATDNEKLTELSNQSQLPPVQGPPGNNVTESRNDHPSARLPVEVTKPSTETEGDKQQKAVKKPRKKYKKRKKYAEDSDEEEEDDSKNLICKRWTEEEDKKLLDAVAFHGGPPHPWSLIKKTFHGTRNARQCKTRYRNKFSPTINYEAFTLEEDEIILAKHQEGLSFLEIAKLLDKRSVEQIRHRYINVIDPSLVTTPWTPEEDRLLTEAQLRLGNKWSEISKVLKGRSQASIKNRWYNRMAKQKLFMRRFMEKAVDHMGPMEGELPASQQQPAITKERLERPPEHAKEEKVTAGVSRKDDGSPAKKRARTDDGSVANTIPPK